MLKHDLVVQLTKMITYLLGQKNLLAASQGRILDLLSNVTANLQCREKGDNQVAQHQETKRL